MTATTTAMAPSRATDGTICKMQIWDTAGQERFRAMAPLYYRNAAVAVVCFDIMDEESFQKMKDWVEELRTNVPEGKLVLAIACTKVCVAGVAYDSPGLADCAVMWCHTPSRGNSQYFSALTV